MRAKHQMEKEAKQEMQRARFQTYSTRKRYSPKRGDIYVTNNASYAKLGIPGHAAIYTGHGHIVEIRGFGHHPIRNSYKRFMYNKRAKRYDKNWVKVYRPNKTRRKSIKYSLNADINNTHRTYCSKLVWQSYYYGAGKRSVKSTGIYHYFSPYTFPKNIRGAKKVKTLF